MRMTASVTSAPPAITVAFAVLTVVSIQTGNTQKGVTRGGPSWYQRTFGQATKGAKQLVSNSRKVGGKGRNCFGIILALPMPF